MRIDPRIQHLNAEQLNELIKRYYSGENINTLIKEYNVNTSASNLYKIFPPIELEAICPYCDVFLLAQYPSKSSYQGALKIGACPNCNHKNDQRCNCRNCRDIEEKNQKIILQQKKDQIAIHLSLNQHEPIDLGDLSFEQRVYLGTIIRDGMTEDFKLIKPFQLFQCKLTPDETFTQEIVHNLSSETRVLVVHPESNPESIVDLDSETGSFSYYTYQVSWSPNVYDELLTGLEVYNRLMNPDFIEIHDLHNGYRLWEKVATYECIEYLKNSIDSTFKMDYTVGEKTILTIKDLLKDYSVSQIYGIIYKATNEALRFHAEKKVTKLHAINSIIGSCRSYAERATSNGWELQKYHRLKSLPQSCISKFLYERVLRIGDNGFYHKPSIDLIKA
ncbi:hypothetical protein [Haliscomenobacter sp.]|uniref:hypothetical protein n=1 Tax=Haliscomenobacter sp. TaxID=2717303 RepID=UPI003BAB9F0B